ncbi:unnamed protein product [Cuscuta europaea]|uniref:Retrovirus-related Pol polyprotein from transposon TNT 1-94-like beta-barrel domain-containing protein n=1 Tax=Cuscuta europaea TaxID=41803 RepID=A0A9P1EM81_CUSEU|nr:unnamed protein product [Cuscuta europaea]
MTNNSSKLLYVNPLKQTSIHTANRGVAPAIGEGPTKVSSYMNLDIVLVVPSLSSNLLSVSQIREALNCCVGFSPNECIFIVWRVGDSSDSWLWYSTGKVVLSRRTSSRSSSSYWNKSGK